MVGTLVMALGLILLSRLSVNTTPAAADVYLLVLASGWGW